METAMINHEDMEKRQKREQIEYQVRMSEAVRQDSRPNVLPRLFVVHDPNITTANLDESINYLEVLLKRTSNMYSCLVSLPTFAQESAKPEYYKALCDVRDFSIRCLELSGELLEKGALNIADPRIVRLARFFCDIQESTPITSPAVMTELRCIELLDRNDPFEIGPFRRAAVGNICSLATIPSGRVLLKTLFDLRYYDPKLDQNRRDHGHYLPTTISINNPLTVRSFDIAPAAYTEQEGKDGQISEDAHRKILPGDFRQTAIVIPPLGVYNEMIQSMLSIIPLNRRSDRCLLQHLAQIDMGHEMIHTIHIAYGVALTMSSSSLPMEERVTAGDELDPMFSALAGETTKADSAIFEHADDSVKEAFIVSEQSLRKDFGAVARHSYKQRVDIDSTNDMLTEEERYVFLFTDEMFQNFTTIGFHNWPYLNNAYEIIYDSIVQKHCTSGAELNGAIETFLSGLERDRKNIIDHVFDDVFKSMIDRQCENRRQKLSPERINRARSILEKLVKKNKLFFETLVSMLKIRIKKDVLIWAMNMQENSSTSTRNTSGASPAASAAAASDSEDD